MAEIGDKLDDLKEKVDNLHLEVKDMARRSAGVEQTLEKWKDPVNDITQLLPELKRALRLVWVALGILLTSTMSNPQLTNVIMKFLGSPVDVAPAAEVGPPAPAKGAVQDGK
jgi:hypothetical protein